jgi:hypothetical protein
VVCPHNGVLMGRPEAEDRIELSAG